ncbi:MAG: pectin esterase [Chitinophagaceae bacterium]|nr:pectin esterase [Chitinophagaceae bacterium]
MKRSLFLLVLFSSVLTSYAQPVTYPTRFTVASDGSGDFRSIQDAIFAVRDLSQQRVTIFIKNGIYHEKLVIPSWKTNISLVGESRDSTIIEYNDYAGKRLAVRDAFLKADSIRTYTSYTLLVEGNDCSIENITIKNSAGRVGQAVALHVEGDRFIAKNCKLLGNQDTIYAATSNSRQYYVDCYIEGTTDFIFGEATAVFMNCELRSLTNSFITAASTRPGKAYGFVFIHCKLLAAEGVNKVYLGRPWRPFAKTVFISTEMGNHIVPAGWDNWKNPENEKTVLYAEYGSSGPGANNTGRAKWTKQLSPKQAKTYTLKNIFRGSGDWLPK